MTQERQCRPPGSIRGWHVMVALLILFFGGLFLYGWAITRMGYRDPDWSPVRRLVIENRTDFELIIFGLGYTDIFGIEHPSESDPPGTEVQLASVDPDSLVVATSMCLTDVVIARTQRGVEIARWHPTDECEEHWVIGWTTMIASFRPVARIENRTNAELVIYSIYRRGGTSSPTTESLVGNVAPGSVLGSGTCPPDGFVARTPGGDEVARWGPGQDCDDPWVIRKPTAIIKNRTDFRLLIYSIQRPGGNGSAPTEVLEGLLIPGLVRRLDTCPPDGFVAKRPRGQEVARWGPGQDCDDPWVIRDPGN